MTHRQRVLSSLARTGYDRIPVKHDATPEINALLMQHFGVGDHEQLLQVIGDDFRYAGPIYRGPELRTFPDGSVEGWWGERYTNQEYEGGTYPEASYLPFAGIDTLDKLDRSHFPSPDWFDYSTIKEQCAALRRQYAVCFGGAGNMDFINGIARTRGVAQVLKDLATRSPVYQALIEARFNFFYQMQERALQAAEGMTDIVHVGEDLGHQSGPLISMKTFETYFAPRYGACFELAHRYGAKTMMHLCGCVERFLPRLIELGLDIEDVVQPTTPEMDIAALAAKYGDRLHFCGTMCVQTTLPFGTAADVEREARRRLALFPRGGLFLGPTHAIQVGTPLENILTMYRVAGSLKT